MTDVINRVVVNANEFARTAHEILSKQENSTSRVISVDHTRQRLANLSLLQDELFHQALTCVERGIYRAAYVMAWAAFMDYVEQKLGSDGLIELRIARPGWTNFKSIEEIRDNIPEHQIIEAARDVGLLSKQEMKALLGALAKRNECAHPSAYRPALNDSLGFVSELIYGTNIVASPRNGRAA